MKKISLYLLIASFLLFNGCTYYKSIAVSEGKIFVAADRGFFLPPLMFGGGEVIVNLVIPIIYRNWIVECNRNWKNIGEFYCFKSPLK